MVADTLSRPGPDGVSSPAAVVATVQNCAVGIDYAALAAAQAACGDCQSMINSPVLRVKKCQVGGTVVWCHLSTGLARPLVPAAWRPQVFAALHNIAHPGIRATRRLQAARYVWPGLAAEVAQMSCACINCGHGKVHSQHATAAQPIEVPARQFLHIHVDLVGPLPASKTGALYLLPIIDRSTRWFEAVPMAAVAAAHRVSALFVHWISRYGVPDQITSDRGPQFTSEVWAVVCGRLGIKRKLGTPTEAGTTKPGATKPGATEPGMAPLRMRPSQERPSQE
jgi:hypothetical protein